jgi:putative membrane-bound dehydrogenase-like protein
MAMGDPSLTVKNQFVCIGRTWRRAVITNVRAITSVQAVSRLLRFRSNRVFGCARLAMLLVMLLAASAIAGEKDRTQSTQWRSLSDEQAETDGEVMLVRQHNTSWLAQGAKPANVTYTVSGGVSVNTVHAIRLDVLLHNDLPAGGPGRAHHGNFVLSRFTARLILPRQPARNIVFSRVGADFSQAGYDVQYALRDKGIEQLGWAIAGGLGRPHYAVFVPKEPLAVPAGARLEIQLHHRDREFQDHVIGHFKLSVTDDAKIASKIPKSLADTKFVPVELFGLPNDLELTVWAQTPLFYNPVNMDFDAQGRLWLIEGMNYSPTARQRPEGDRVMVIEDTDKDGKADHSHMFVQEESFQTTMGLAVIGNRIFVSQPPAMLVFTDVDGDAKFDPKVDRREEFITGFRGHDHGHGLYANVAGPDGRFYFSAGNYTAGAVTDRSGRVFRIGSHYFAEQFADVMGQKSDDGHVYVGGVAYRVDPDGKNLAVVGHNMRNPVGLTISSFGDMFNNDNDDPPNCRTTWLMEHGNLGFASNDGRRSWRADMRPGQTSRVAHWRQDDPGIIPAGDVYGGGAPVDIAFYENGALGEKYRGMVLSCEAGRNIVFGYLPQPKGAGFTMNRFDFLTPNTTHEFVNSDFVGRGETKVRKTEMIRSYFRPSDVAVGPDGAIYIADWFDSRVGGHRWNDRGANGTIYRIAPKGATLSVPKLELDTIAGQVEGLKNPAVNVRYQAFAKLKEAGDQAVPALKELLRHDNPYVRVRAVWLFAHSTQGRVELQKMLGHPDAQMRVAAFRAMRAAGITLLDVATRLAKDKSPAVRREVALAMRDVDWQDAKPILSAIAQGYDGSDRWYLEAWGTGCSGKESVMYRRLLELAGSDALAWTAPMADLVWRLHPPEAVAALKQRALQSTFSKPTRKRAMDTLAFIRNKSAAEAMLEIANHGPQDQKSMAAWWISNRHEQFWHSYNVKSQLSRGMLDPKKLAQDWTTPKSNLPPLPPLTDILAIRGDAGRGDALYSGRAQCSKCHKLRGRGEDVGPDLSEVSKVHKTREALLKNIIDPSASIAQGFEGVQIITTDGKIFSGVVISAGDPLILKDQNGNRIAIATDDIDVREKMTVSLMPKIDNLGLSGQELADIVEHLLKSQ